MLICGKFVISSDSSCHVWIQCLIKGSKTWQKRLLNPTHLSPTNGRAECLCLCIAAEGRTGLHRWWHTTCCVQGWWPLAAKQWRLYGNVEREQLKTNRFWNRWPPWLEHFLLYLTLAFISTRHSAYWITLVHRTPPPYIFLYKFRQLF